MWKNERHESDSLPAFTLVELLVVISIIALVSSISLFTLYGVREDAKESRGARKSPGSMN